VQHARQFFSAIALQAHADGIDEPDEPAIVFFKHDEIRELEIAIEEFGVSDAWHERADRSSARHHLLHTELAIKQRLQRGLTFGVGQFEREDAAAEIDAKGLKNGGGGESGGAKPLCAANLALRLGDAEDTFEKYPQRDRPDFARAQRRARRVRQPDAVTLMRLQAANSMRRFSGHDRQHSRAAGIIRADDHGKWTI